VSDIWYAGFYAAIVFSHMHEPARNKWSTNEEKRHMTQPNEDLQAIASEMIAMSEADQKMRKSGVWDASLDVKHTERMRQIIGAIGWPTIAKVGPVASRNAWLLVQHADHDLEFQRQCLALMKAQPAGEVHIQNIAYLEDRVRIREGRPQLYGPQFHTTEQGDVEPFPIEDAEQVDVRRAEVGLGTLAEYAARMRSHRKAQ
jgi:hypothetical protein